MLMKKFLSISHLKNFISTFTPAASNLVHRCLYSLHTLYTSIYLNGFIQIHVKIFYIMFSCVKTCVSIKPKHRWKFHFVDDTFYSRVDFIWPYCFCWYASIQEHFRFKTKQILVLLYINFYLPSDTWFIGFYVLKSIHNIYVYNYCEVGRKKTQCSIGSWKKHNISRDINLPISNELCYPIY